VRGRLRIGRNAYVVFVLLFAITSSFAPALTGHSPGAVLSVAALTPAAANSTVTNDLTMVSSSISLGSTLQAQGQAHIGIQPLQGAPVSLYIGDLTVAHTITDQNGSYSFSAPVGLYYFPAVVSRGASVYTVVEPSSASSVSAPSAPISVSVNYLPLYVTLGIVAAAILLSIALLARRRRKHAAGESAAMRDKKTSAPIGSASGSPSEYSAAREGVYAEAAQEGPVFAPEGAGEQELVNQARAFFAQGNDRAAVNALYDAALASLAVGPVARAPLRALTALYDRANFSGAPLNKEQQDAAIEAFRMIESRREPLGREQDLELVNQARAFFAQGNDRAAVNALYDAALASLADVHSLTLERDLTHLERYRVLEAAVPEVREPVRTLTTLYELANYSGKRLTTEQRNAAIRAYEWIEAHVRSLKSA
jgi:hypothetical protein